MTAQQIANELLREWQECPADEMQLMRELTCVHLSFNSDSDRAKGTYDVEDTAHPLS